jgi:hypothetical protein
MSFAIKQVVTVRAAGVLEVHSPDLHPGDHAEVTVVVTPQSSAITEPSAGGHWREFAGAVNVADSRGADNESIDADLADEYQRGGGGAAAQAKG